MKESFFNSFFKPCFIQNIHGVVVAINDSFQKLLGWSLSDLQEIGLEKIIHPEDSCIYKFYYQKLILDPYELTKFSFRIKNIDGFYLPLIWESKFDNNQKVINSIFYHADKRQDIYCSDKDIMFKEIIDNLPVPITLWDINMDLYYVNKAFSNFSGIENQELEIINLLNTGDRHFQEKYKNFIAEDIRSDYLLKYKACFNKKSEFISEAKLLTKDNKYIWMLISSMPFYQKSGEFAGYIGVAQDIQNIKDNNRVLDLVCESIGEGSWYWFIERNEVCWSNSFKALLGYGPNEIESSYENYFKLLHPEHVKLVGETIDKCFKERLPYNNEVLLKTKNNQYRWFETVGRAIWDKDGNPVVLAGTIKDINDRKITQDFVKNLYSMFSKLDINYNSKITNLFKLFLEYSEIRVACLISLDDKNWKTALFVRKSDYDSKEEKIYFKKNYFPKLKNIIFDNSTNNEIGVNSVFVDESCFFVPIWNNSRKYGIICFWDPNISVSKMTKKEMRMAELTVDLIGKEIVKRNFYSEIYNKNKILKKINKQLIKKSQEVEDFAYIVTHDLKEPLRGISNYIQVLLSNYEDDLSNDIRKILTNMRWQTEYLGNLIENVFTYSQLDYKEYNAKNIDLDKEIRVLIRFIKESYCGEDIEFIIHNQLPVVVSDIFNIKEIFRNLITNAIKYNDKKKKIIEIGVIDSDSAKRYEFYIKDNGIGISKDFYNKIFKLFKRLHLKHEYSGGTGFGLTYVKRILEKMGGKIRVESKENEGTTFYFTILDLQS